MKSHQRLVLLTSNFIHIFGISMLAPVYALFGLKVGASPWQIGLTWALYNAIAGAVNIIGGRFEDGTKRKRRLIITGYLITAAGVAMFLFITHPSQLYLAQIVSAVGVGFYMPAWKSAYAKAGDRAKAASQWGMFDGTNMIAMAGAALLAGWLVNYGHYTALFAGIMALYLTAAGVILAYR